MATLDSGWVSLHGKSINRPQSVHMRGEDPIKIFAPIDDVPVGYFKEYDPEAGQVLLKFEYIDRKAEETGKTAALNEEGFYFVFDRASGRLVELRIPCNSDCSLASPYERLLPQGVTVRFRSALGSAINRSALPLPLANYQVIAQVLELLEAK